MKYLLARLLVGALLGTTAAHAPVNAGEVPATICDVKAEDVCDGGNRQLGDAAMPHRLTATQRANIERTKRQLLKELKRNNP